MKCQGHHLAEKDTSSSRAAAWTIVGYGSLAETHPPEHTTDKRIAFAHSPEDLESLAIDQSKVTDVRRDFHRCEPSQQVNTAEEKEKSTKAVRRTLGADKHQQGNTRMAANCKPRQLNHDATNTHA